jgi:hypothetical protein
MIPEGAQPFDAKISQDIKVTFTVPGVYVIACKPHTAMGMVQATQQTSTRSTRAPFPARLGPSSIPCSNRSRKIESRPRGQPRPANAMVLRPNPV